MYLWSSSRARAVCDKCEDDVKFLKAGHTYGFMILTEVGLHCAARTAC